MAGGKLDRENRVYANAYIKWTIFDSIKEANYYCGQPLIDFSLIDFSLPDMDSLALKRSFNCQEPSVQIL